MAYDPADLRLPPWLLRFFDALVRLRLPLGTNWRIGMTRPGILLTAALVGIWLAAFYSGNNLLYLCGAMLTALAAAAVLRGIRLLRNLPSLDVFEVPVLEAGEAAVLRESQQRQSDTAAIVETEFRSSDMQLALQLRIEPAQTTLQGRLKPERRGVFVHGHEILSTTAPLGLYALSYARGSTASIVVMPKARAWVDAGQLSRTLQEGDEWRDLRAYAAGDSLARVHWRKATMEARDWTVKRFARHERDEADDWLCVDLRLPDGMAAERFEMLLGKAWFWLKSRRQGRIDIGRQSFDLAMPEARRQAIVALAAARPESMPPAMGGIRLSLVEGSA